MEKETRITAPEGCEIEKVEIVDGAAVVTFKEKERKLPKSWEEFCEMFPIKKGEAYFSTYHVVEQYKSNYDSRAVEEKMTLPDRATAEAVLALCQLIQLRNAYNGEWAPEWTDCNSIKYVLDFQKSRLLATDYVVASSPLFFKTEEIRDEFLQNFRPLIEKLKPLYGIKEGGEE